MIRNLTSTGNVLLHNTTGNILLFPPFKKNNALSYDTLRFHKMSKDVKIQL